MAAGRWRFTGPRNAWKIGTIALWVVALVAVGIAAIVGGGSTSASATSAGASGVWVETAAGDGVVFINGSDPGATPRPVGLTQIGEILKMGDPVDGLQVIVGTLGIAVLDVNGGGIVQVVLDDSIDVDNDLVVATASGVWLATPDGVLRRFAPNGGAWEVIGELGSRPVASVLDPAQQLWVIQTAAGAKAISYDPRFDHDPDLERFVNALPVSGTVVSLGADDVGPIVSTTTGLYRINALADRIAVAGGLSVSVRAGESGTWAGLEPDGRVTVTTADRRRTASFDPPAIFRPIVSAGRIWVATSEDVLELNDRLQVVRRHPRTDTRALLAWAGGVVADGPDTVASFVPGRDPVEVSKQIPLPSGDTGGGDETTGENGQTREGQIGEIDPDNVNQVAPLIEQRPPIAKDDADVVGPGRHPVAVLRNDLDPNGDSLRVAAVGPPTSGTGVTLTAEGGAVVAEVASNATGPVVFEYTVTDDRCDEGQCADTATVTLDVDLQVGNRAPVPTPNRELVVEGTTARIDLIGDDVDPDGDEMSLVGVDLPPAIRVEIISNIAVVTVPADYPPGVLGPADYLVSDGAEVARGVLVLEVAAADANHAPVANPDPVAGVPGQQIPLDPTANDRDPDGDALTLVGVEGGLVPVGNSITITVPASTTILSYEIRDPGQLTANGRILVQVVPPGTTPPDPPIDAVPTTAAGGSPDGSAPATTVAGPGSGAPTGPPGTGAPPITAPPTSSTAPTTAPPSTAAPATVAPTTVAPVTTAPPTTAAPTTAAPTTAPPTTVPPAGWRAQQVAAGNAHTCALTTTETVKCWGFNQSGQLGSGDNLDRWTPLDIPSLQGVQQIAAGKAHTCALISGGTVKCWGFGQSGQLGTGDNLDHYGPTDVGGLTNVVQITAGNAHTCALISGGAVECWGFGQSGQLGNDDNRDYYSPSAVIGITDAVQIAAGRYHTCAVLATGGIKCWGFDLYGQLGDGGNLDQWHPVDVVGITGAKAVTAGCHHTCALLTNGTARCWGQGTSGQLGNGGFSDRSDPVAPSVSGVALPGIAQISAGNAHTCALLTSGTVKCWGEGVAGQLGNNTANTTASPIDVAGLTGVAQISAGSDPQPITFVPEQAHTCAVASTGTVRCWGYGASGQLGAGSNTDAWIPVAVVGT